MKKLTVWIYDDNGSCKNPPSWFTHGNDIKVSWKQIKELLDAGNNITLTHYCHGSYILSIDN